MPQSTHEKIVRVGAAYDILAMAPFALPIVSVWAYALIQWVDLQLGFDSHFSALDPTAIFLLNIGAWAYLVWGVVRWRAPTREHARLSALLRVIVVVVQGVAVSSGASPFLLVLGAVQLLLAVLEFSHRLFERSGAPSSREEARAY